MTSMTSEAFHFVWGDCATDRWRYANPFGHCLLVYEPPSLGTCISFEEEIHVMFALAYHISHLLSPPRRRRRRRSRCVWAKCVNDKEHCADAMWNWSNDVDIDLVCILEYTYTALCVSVLDIAEFQQKWVALPSPHVTLHIGISWVKGCVCFALKFAIPPFSPLFPLECKFWCSWPMWVWIKYTLSIPT